MPSVSPGNDAQSTFRQIIPGAPVPGDQSTTTLVFRWKRYVFYISKHQLNILRSPQELVQTISFEGNLVALTSEPTEGGRIALIAEKEIWVLKPVTSASNRVTWAKELLLEGLHGDEPQSLSWTTEGELLIGGSAYLSLYNTSPSSRVGSPIDTAVLSVERRTALWSKSVASPLRFSRISPSAYLIATSATHDRLVKIWRRLSFEEAVFDFAYLPHDGLITHLEWRAEEPAKLEIGQDFDDGRSVRSFHAADEHCEVLYTLATDAQLRIWRTNGHHDLEMLSLYTIIDLVSAIPHSPALQSKPGIPLKRPARYTFLIPSFEYGTAAATALKKHPQRQLRHSMEHVREVATRKPDIVVVVDGQGRMSAWGLSSIAHKRRLGLDSHSPSPFHIAHSDDMGLQMGDSVPAPATFETWFDGDMLNILMHEFGAGVKWWQGNVEDFSSSAAISEDRGLLIASLTGSEDVVDRLSTSVDLKTMFSWTHAGQLTSWNVGHGTLKLQSTINRLGRILAVDFVQPGKSILVVKTDAIDLIKLSDHKATITRSHPLSDCTDLHMLRLGSTNTVAKQSYLLYGTNGRYCVVDVNPTRCDWESPDVGIDVDDRSQQFDLGPIKQDLTETRVVLHPRKRDWIRVIAVCADGRLIRKDITIISLRTSQGMAEQIVQLQLYIRPGLFDTLADTAALISVDGKSLIIADLKGNYIEHRATLDQTPNSIAFARQAYSHTLPTGRCVLAVSYPYAVDVLSRAMPTTAAPSRHWLTVKRVSIENSNLPLSSLCWMRGGHLALAFGAGIMIIDNSVATRTLDLDIQQTLSNDQQTVLQLSDRLNAPIACWHTNVLQALVRVGRLHSVVAILRRLTKKLRFHAQGDHMDPLLGLDPASLLESTMANDESFGDLCNMLEETDLPNTSEEEQDMLKIVVRTVEYVLGYIDSLDTHALRYLFDWRLQVLMKVGDADTTINGDIKHVPGSKIVPEMHWREIVFAYHSQTQQPLLEALVQYYENKLDWGMVRALGIGMWLHTVNAAQSEGSAMSSLEQIFDALGQSAYRASQPPNPADASLFLLALRKKAVLLSLWRVAIGNNEQKSTQNFLKRNFNLEEHRVAARKNAYALMGKRRFYYAAAFFLLADDVSSAVSLLAAQCEDLQLAVAVARLYCGDKSTFVGQFINDRAVPGAQKQGDRWMLHWAYHMIDDVSSATGALIGNLASLMGETWDISLKTWQHEDPATLSVYRSLRDVPGHAAKPTARLPAATEYQAVLRAARVFRRQGFWLLALSLARDWRFLPDPKPQQQSQIHTNGAASGSTSDVPNLLDDFGVGSHTEQKPSEMVDRPKESVHNSAEPSEAASPVNTADDRAAKAAALLAKLRAKNAAKSLEPGANVKAGKDKAPTQFKEPTANSLLDSFGF